MTAKFFQHGPDRPVIGNPIVFWLNAPEPVAAIGMTQKYAPKVEIRLNTLLLNIVEPFVIGLPDIQTGPFDGRTIHAGHLAVNDEGFAFSIQADVGSVFPCRRIRDMERSKNGGLRGAARLAVVDGVDKHRHAQDIRQQDEFLPPVVAHVSGRRQKLDRLEPFFLGRLDFLGGFMEVADDDIHDLPEALVLCVGVAARHNFGAVGFGEISLFMLAGHSASPSSSS